jgi:hypothetical protein
MEDKNEQKHGQLKDLIPSKWFANRMESSCWLRIYTCLYVPHKDFSQRAFEATSGVPFHESVYFGFYVMNGLSIPDNEYQMYASEDGVLRLDIKQRNLTLKNANYVLVFTPKKIDGKELEEKDIRQKLDVVTSILRTHTGLNFMRSIVYEGEVEAGIDRFSSASRAIKLPQAVEGPYITSNNWLQSKEIFDQINLKPKEKRDRIYLSLQYYCQALDSMDSFFLYWTALEILCQGKSQTIKNRLRIALGFKTLQQVEAIGFGRIATWRHNFFHKGIRPILSSDVERYLQLVYLDLLRSDLGLLPAMHTINLTTTDGYDLSPIGLANRKPSIDSGTESKKIKDLIELFNEAQTN